MNLNVTALNGCTSWNLQLGTNLEPSTNGVINSGVFTLGLSTGFVAIEFNWSDLPAAIGSGMGEIQYQFNVLTGAPTVTRFGIALWVQ